MKRIFFLSILCVLASLCLQRYVIFEFSDLFRVEKSVLAGGQMTQFEIGKGCTAQVKNGMPDGCAHLFYLPFPAFPNGYLQKR